MEPAEPEPSEPDFETEPLELEPAISETEPKRTQPNWSFPDTRESSRASLCALALGGLFTRLSDFGKSQKSAKRP